MPHVPQLNVEYWFRLIYDCITGACYGHGTVNVSSLISFLTDLWVWVTVLGYLIAVLALFVIVYATVRLYDLRKDEEEFYGTVLVAPDESGEDNPRWKHVTSLLESDNPNDWRQAVVEADIMLDEMLTRQGYTGESVGEKLKEADRASFNTLDDAWEAHKVRNQIAHEGSAFDLSDTLAHRTIARYENVFREFELV